MRAFAIELCGRLRLTRRFRHLHPGAALPAFGDATKFSRLCTITAASAALGCGGGHPAAPLHPFSGEPVTLPLPPSVAGEVTASVTLAVTLKEDGSINGMLDLRNAGPAPTLRTPATASSGPQTAAAPHRVRQLAPWLVMAALLGLTAMRAHSVAADPVAVATGTVNSPDGLNLRNGPDTTYDVLAVMPDGASVLVTGAAADNNWLPVTFNQQRGWTDGEYLTLSAAPSEAPAAQPAPAPPAPASGAASDGSSAVVNSSDGLNLRDGPGTSAKVITVIPGGATVSVAGAARDGWTPVTFNGSSGWVDSSYLSSGSPATITANAGATSSGATLGATAGSGATNAPASAPARLAWPTNSRRIATVFSPAHLGVDIADASGTPIGASAAGTVSFAGGDPCCSYGLYVIVDHGNGISTLYAHMSSIAVQKGQAVSQGQKLGSVGCTGHCTGPHIHFEVRVNGTQVDPLRYLPPPWTIE
jgi:murein DD-endopeptidase MepM/ murein hydrolase activator NlpD